MLRGTPVISAGFQAKISKFCLSKEHSSLRPFSVNVDPMATICSRYSGWIAIFIFSSSTWLTAGGWMLDLEIIAHSIGMTLLLCSVTVSPSTGNFNILCAVDEVDCTSSPILTSNAIWPSGQMVSPLNPISNARIRLLRMLRRQHIPGVQSARPFRLRLSLVPPFCLLSPKVERKSSSPERNFG
ncbi:hypothetical protein Tco_0459423 [Tanacetum coccineum]